MNCTKKYTAILSQAGLTPPQVIAAKSDFINPVTWTRSEEGVYVGTCDDLWDSDRTHVVIHATSGNSVLHAGSIITGNGQVTLYFDNEDSVNTVNLVITEFL